MKMRLRKNYNSGISLLEVVTTVAILVLLGTLSMPAIDQFIDSMSSSGSVEMMVRSALSSARVMAMERQRNVGIRFQRDYLTGRQYIIFIEYEGPELITITTGYKAVEGIKPVQLPDTMEVLDRNVRTNTTSAINSSAQSIDAYALLITEVGRKEDLRAFSIVFSPKGQLIQTEVRVRNRDGVEDPGITESNDDVFNSWQNIEAGYGQFVQDDYASLGYGREYSRVGFAIVNKKEFDSWTDLAKCVYLTKNEYRYFVSVYGGELIYGGQR